MVGTYLLLPTGVGPRTSTHSTKKRLYVAENGLGMFFLAVFLLSVPAFDPIWGMVLGVPFCPSRQSLSQSKNGHIPPLVHGAWGGEGGDSVGDKCARKSLLLKKCAEFPPTKLLGVCPTPSDVFCT